MIRSKMGILGFSISFRDKFSNVVSNDVCVGVKCVVCFDVTPIVVNALRNVLTIETFGKTFVDRMLISNEYTFLRHITPLELHYTLDNRSPRAKRQTQLR